MIYTDVSGKEYEVTVKSSYGDVAKVIFPDGSEKSVVAENLEEENQLMTASDYLCKHDISCCAASNLTIVAKALAAEHDWEYKRDSYGYGNTSTWFHEEDLDMAFDILNKQKSMF
jgi:hypothetical protein